MTGAERAWAYTRNIVTVLSLVNVLSVYLEKSVAGSSSFMDVLDDANSRVRFWATAVLLAVTGVLALGHLLVSTRDVASDLHPHAGVRRVVTLCFGLAQLAVAGGVAALLLATR